MHLLKLIVTIISTWGLYLQEKTTDLVARFRETAVRPFENFLAIGPSPEHKDDVFTVFATVTSTFTATPTATFSTTTYADGNIAVVATSIPTPSPVALPQPDICLAPFAWANWEDVTFCISEAEFDRLSASATALWETPASRLLRSLLDYVSNRVALLWDIITPPAPLPKQWSQQMLIAFAPSVTGCTFMATPAKIKRCLRYFSKSLTWPQVFLCYFGLAVALFLLVGAIRVLAEKHEKQKELRKEGRTKYEKGRHIYTVTTVAHALTDYENRRGPYGAILSDLQAREQFIKSVALTTTLVWEGLQIDGTALVVCRENLSALAFLWSYVIAFFEKQVEVFQGKYTNQFEFWIFCFYLVSSHVACSTGLCIAHLSQQVLDKIFFEVAPTCILVMEALFMALGGLSISISLMCFCVALAGLLRIISAIQFLVTPVLDRAGELWKQVVTYLRLSLEGVANLPLPSQDDAPPTTPRSLIIHPNQPNHFSLTYSDDDEEQVNGLGQDKGASPEIPEDCRMEKISRWMLDDYERSDNTLYLIKRLIEVFPGDTFLQKLELVVDYAWEHKCQRHFTPKVRSESTKTPPAQTPPAQTPSAQTAVQSPPVQTPTTAVVENESLKLQIEELKTQLKQQDEKHKKELEAQAKTPVDFSTVTMFQAQIKALEDAAKTQGTLLSKVQEALDQEKASHANTEGRRLKLNDELADANYRANEFEDKVEKIRNTAGSNEQAIRSQLLLEHESQINQLRSERDTATSDLRSERIKRQLAEKRAESSEKNFNDALNSPSPAPISRPTFFQQRSATVADGQDDGMAVDAPDGATTVEETEMSDAPTVGQTMGLAADGGHQQQSSSMEVCGPPQTYNNQTYFTSNSSGFNAPSVGTQNTGAPMMAFGTNQAVNNGFQPTATQSNQPAGGVFGNLFSGPLFRMNQAANSGFQGFGTGSNQPSTGTASSVLPAPSFGAKPASSALPNRTFAPSPLRASQIATSAPEASGSANEPDTPISSDERPAQDTQQVQNTGFSLSGIATGKNFSPATPSKAGAGGVQPSQQQQVQKQGSSPLSPAYVASTGVTNKANHLEASSESSSTVPAAVRPPILPVPVDENGNHISPVFVPNMTAPVSGAAPAAKPTAPPSVSYFTATTPSYVPWRQSASASAIVPGSLREPLRQSMMAGIMKAPQEESDEEEEYENVNPNPVRDDALLDDEVATDFGEDSESAEADEPEEDRTDASEKAKVMRRKNWVEQPLERKRAHENGDDEEGFEETSKRTQEASTITNEEQRGRATSEHSMIQSAAEPLPAEQRFDAGDRPQISDYKLRQTHRGRDGTYEHPVPILDDPNEYVHEFMPYTPDLRSDDPRTPQGCRDLNCIKQTLEHVVHDCVLEQILKKTRELEAKQKEEQTEQVKWRQEKARIQQQREQDGEIFEV